MSSNGIDVSNNNGLLTLTRGFSGLDFVVAKATEGLNFIDRDFGWYEQQAKAANALFGAYHFGHPELRQGRAEADHFMTFSQPQSARSLWYDYEVYGDSPEADAEEISIFTDRVKGRYPHARVGVYFNLTGARRLLPLDFDADALWLAYPQGQLETPDHPLAPWGKAWQIHQYATVGGVDRNYSRWTRDEMRAFFGNWPPA
jgi:GH25 family lysozyme M1 (1,4-beta-N-acetylmuramidase)